MTDKNNTESTLNRSC